MNSKLLVCLVILTVSMLIPFGSRAGFGDGSGPFDSGKAKEENKDGNTINSGDAFGSALFGNEEEQIMAGPPPRDFDPVPLDGGASLLLLGGLGVGITRSLRKRSRINGVVKR